MADGLVSAEDFMALGLELVGYKRWRRYSEKTNINNFKAHFGATPGTCEAMWVDVKTDNPECATSKNGPSHFLIALRWLWKYPTEKEMSPLIGSTEKTIRRWRRVYVKYIQKLLRSRKMRCLEEAAEDGLKFLLSVDGTHCPIWEPRPFSTKNSSHKFGGKPGFNYEIGLRISKPELLWVKGPTQPGKTNDGGVFEEGLKHFLPAGTKAIADDGYQQFPEYVSVKNPFDSFEVANFKNRVMARHEKFNNLLKNWNCLSTKFRHGKEEHKAAFEAVCAITAYQLENRSQELFDPYP